MHQVLKILSLLLFIHSTQVLSSDWNCSPSKTELDEFFQGVDHWTEVAPNTNVIDSTNPAELIVNTTDVESTSIIRDGKVLRTQLNQACLSKDGKRVFLTGKAKALGFWWNGKMRLRVVTEELILGELEISIGSFPFVFRPDYQVKRN